MARQDLAYAITVNDAQLRLATQQVAAFNAELAASTVTGRKLDESLRAVGRRSVQVGNFFTRNLTVPLLLGGAAAAKYAAEFQKASARVQGLAGVAAGDMERLNDAVLKLSSKEASLGPNALETAVFHLRSAGLSTTQTIKALKPVSEAAVSGLGDIASVTTAVTSAMDSYGFKNLNAAHATDVLIETVRKGNIPVSELSAALGRVTSIAAAMHIPFEQVGGAIASITRQMPNANLAVTGLRAILQTFLKDQPQTEKALNAIGASGAGVQASLNAKTGPGLFPTLLALRSQFKGLHVDTKLLEQAYNDGGKSQAKFIASLGNEGEALAKLFPNIRALAAFLIITGSNAKLNANVFAELNATSEHTGQALARTFGAFSKTDQGKLRLALGQLQVDAVKIGPTFIRLATDLLQLGNSAIHFFEKLGPFKGFAKDLGIGLLVFGPLVSLFGRLTQGVSGGVTMWGRWQEQATLAAYKAKGVDVETAKLIITSRKAAVQFDEGFTSMAAAADRTTAAVERLNTAVAGGSVRSNLAARTAGAALLTKTAGGRAVSRGTAQAAVAEAEAEAAVSNSPLLGVPGGVLAAQALARRQALGRAAGTPGAGIARSLVLGSGSPAKEAEKLATEMRDPTRIVAKNWDTAMVGMRSAAKLSFDLIALTFATDVVGKLIFGGHQARQSLENDFTNIAKSGTGIATAIGGVAIGLLALRNAGGLAGLTAGFEGLSLAALGFRGKIALAGASFLGLKLLGANTSQAINAGMIGMLARSVALRAGIFEVGAAFGPWGIAAAAAVTTVLISTGKLQEALGGIKDEFLNIIHGHPFKDDFKEKAFGSISTKLTEAAQQGKLADTNIGAMREKLLKLGDTKSVDALIAKLRELKQASGGNTDVLNGITEFQKQQLEAAHLTTKQQAAVVSLFKKGLDTSAENLINQFEFQAAKREAADAIKTLKNGGHAVAADLLAKMIDTAKQTKTAYKQLFDNLGQSLDNAFSAHTQTMLDSFDKQSQSILDKFDERTQALEDKLKTTVKLKNGETFTVTVNGKTPAERELDALDKISEKRNFQRDLFDSRSALAQARLIGDPGAIRDAERKVQDAQTEQRRFGLESRATKERTAADAAIKQAQHALENRRKIERQGIEDARAEARKNIEATRTIMQQNLDNMLKAEATLYSEGKISLATYQKDVQGIMKRFGISVAQAGHDGGKAYGDQLRSQLNTLEKDVKTTLDKIVKKAQDVAVSMALAARSVGMNEQAAQILGIAGVANPGVPGLVGSTTAITPASVAAAQKAAAAQTAKTGIPTRPAIVAALKAMDGGIDFARYGKFIPVHGRPSAKEYNAFLNKITDSDVRAELRSRLNALGFMRANSGAVVPGHGTQDTVPAMLTPGEIVLNSRQQGRLASMLGLGKTSPGALFSLIAQRFAGGGVVSEHGYGQDRPIVPKIRIAGLDKLNDKLDKLGVIIAQNSAAQQNAVNDPRVISLIQGMGSAHMRILDARDRPGPEGDAQRKLMKLLNPISATSAIKKSLGADVFNNLPVDKKRELEAQVAQLQAHPVLGGLISITPTGATVGGAGKIRLPRSQSIPAAAFQGGAGIHIENMTISVDGGNNDPDAVARKVAREFEKRSNRLVRQRRGSRAGGIFTK